MRPRHENGDTLCYRKYNNVNNKYKIVMSTKRGSKCSLCSDHIPKADVEKEDNLLSSDVKRELNDIIIFTSETLLDHDCRLCEACLNLVEQRMETKAQLREADQRIRARYFDAMFKRTVKKCCSRTNRVIERTFEQETTRTFCEKFVCETSEINHTSSRGCVEASRGSVKDEKISSVKCENEVVKSEFKETFCKQEYDSMYKLEKELWSDNDDDYMECKTNIDKENM